MAGHKGYGLALMIEILSGGLSGSAMREDVGIWMLEPRNKPTDHSHAFIAVNPEVFLGKDAFPARLDDLFTASRAAPSSKAALPSRSPGRSNRTAERRPWPRASSFPRMSSSCCASPPRKTAAPCLHFSADGSGPAAPVAPEIPN